MSHYTNQRIITEQEWWNSLRSQIGQTTYSESYCVDLNEKMDFLDPSKSPILQGVKKAGQAVSSAATDFAGGFGDGLKAGYGDGTKAVEELGKFLAPKFIDTAKTVAWAAEKFADKFGISPVSASMIIGAAAFGGPAAIPAVVLAMLLRKVASNLSNKIYDTVWEKATGKKVEELDQMWRDWNDKHPIAGTPKVVADSFNSFDSFLKNKDVNLYQKIYLENEYQLEFSAGEVGEKIGSVLGYGAGAINSVMSNLILGSGKMVWGVLKYIAGHPVAAGKVLFGVIIGYIIGHYGAKATQKVTDMIQGKLSASETDAFKKAAEEAKVPKEEIQKIANDTGNKDFVNYLENPPEGSVNVADARSLAKKGWDMPVKLTGGTEYEINPVYKRLVQELDTDELADLPAKGMGNPIHFWQAINRSEVPPNPYKHFGAIGGKDLFDSREKSEILKNMIQKLDFDKIDKDELLKHTLGDNNRRSEILDDMINNWQKYKK